MIRAKNLEPNFLTEYTDGTHTGASDAPAEKGGQGADFQPLALLEASLATCVNITLRVYAQAHGIDLPEVETTATLTPGAEGSTFEYTVNLPASVTPEQKKRLLAATKACPIHGVLSKPITFKLAE
jgi:putative redox protein